MNMSSPLPDITVNLDSGIIFVNGVPDCFLTPQHAHAYTDSWIHTPQNVNVEGDAYANTDNEDVRCEGDATIIYDCVAWH
jgi:hypothetical protein